MAVSPAEDLAPEEGEEAEVIHAFRPSRPLEQLVPEALAGDVAAQEALFHRFVDGVERRLYRILGRDPELADVMQEVFLEVFRNLGHLREPAAMPGWVGQITVATARKKIRSRSRRRWLRFFPPEEVPEVEHVDEDDEVRAAMQATYRILDTMGVDLRIAFALRHLDQMELTDVAESVGVSLATIKRRLRKAEELFAARARRDEALVDWLERGERWPS